MESEQSPISLATLRIVNTILISVRFFIFTRHSLPNQPPGCSLGDFLPQHSFTDSFNPHFVVVA